MNSEKADTPLARSLVKQTSCLATKTSDLGYKCEPLFEDLFDYQDYCALSMPF